MILARLGNLATLARRTAFGPALIRVIAGLSALAGVLLAAPQEVLAKAPAPVAGAGVVAAVLVGLLPRSRWVGIVLVAVILEWLVSTLGLGEETGPVRVGLIAIALYLTHASAALAAVMPYDALAVRSVFTRWAGRVATVLAVGVLVGVGGMALAGFLPSARSVVGPIVGSLVAAGLAGLLAWQLRRR